MKIANISAFISLAIIAAGCAYNRPPGYAYQDDGLSSRRAAAYQRRADQDLANSVRDQFGHYGYLNDVSQNVEVTASGGTVTLTGSVPSRKDRDMIDAMVRNTRGVVAVNDLLEVTGLRPTARSDSPSGYQNSRENITLHVQSVNETDRQLAQQILNELRNDPVLRYSSSPVDIYVANGQVTLQGGVESDAEKQMILAAVQRAAGPGVVSDLKVRPLVR